MKLKSILIANRGEIAVRIIQTAKNMNIKTYVIKTKHEPNALYLQLADEVIDFTENLNEIAEFLDTNRIIAAAKEYKIESIHPGYGYLAENPEFGKICEDEGIIFIGPSSDAILRMGNKTIAKKIAIEHNIPLLKGSNGNVPDVKTARKVAKEIGYPVIVKAASGGGGRGMRIVEKEENLEKMFNMASSEAEKVFNDPDVFIEKYVKNPRHIEFQIIGDKHGNVVHLGERECSIQRKHQKLIEEAPSAALDEKLREKMGQVAINVAKSVNYYSTGTVEFLLDDNKDFTFMEMNTRIQVEHPITESITGLDLVEQQIRVAQGEKLSFKQKDIKFNGWAMEFRINAEDVQSGFSPYLGTIKKISFPRSKYVRVDSGVQSGSVVTASFDSMIAKIIVSGETREKCISNSINALSRLKIQGIKTTQPFCKAVLHNKVFRKGVYNTSFIENDLGQLFHQEADEEMLAAFFATNDFVTELRSENEAWVDYDKGKDIAPWVMNKRMKSL